MRLQRLYYGDRFAAVGQDNLVSRTNGPDNSRELLVRFAQT